MKSTTFDLVAKVVKSIDDKLGQNITVLDLNGITTLCDYFVITSTPSIRQVKAITDEIQDRLEEEGIYVLHREGYTSGRWVLLDYGDIVIHILYKEDREFYNIEGIWKDAVTIDVDKIINNNI
ncbi:iojap-like ribosome-associated protein [Clostridium aceticum]|uniref:Ribosomal silencing factor RsfS n=1 Tax=Clostridium aceticum TaxID=84022 RepID=A0A0D8ICG2_9CLOT|nr:ribosome silencing factor [Clostridium aceticum]AKL95115.1 iojap-like ribosome-associated protein [Clostridium aceticum]KJF27995.1 iojap family protein [Clostridium aceticum]